MKSSPRSPTGRSDLSATVKRLASAPVCLDRLPSQRRDTPDFNRKALGTVVDRTPSESPTRARSPSFTCNNENQHNRIQVAVRIRPVNEQERQLKSKSVFRQKGSTVEELDDDGIRPTGKVHPYDNVFGPEVSNEEVYTRQCKSIVQGCLEGFNGTIFAYGQTSSGKTYTVMGDLATSPGVTPRAIEDVFQWVANHPINKWDVLVAYLQIYNESITDLLQKDPGLGTNLKITDDATFGTMVRDLTEKSARDAQEALSFFKEGEKRRSYGATGMNANSSRSHTIFRIRISSKRQLNREDEDESVDAMRKVAHELFSMKTTIGAERASLFLVDQEQEQLYTYAGDLTSSPGTATLRIPMSQGVAGAVATTGEKINIADAYADSRFNSDVDKKTGYRTQTILSLPVFEPGGKVGGVVQFINKKGGVSFDSSDEALVEELSQSIGPAISKAQSNTRSTVVSLLNLVDLAGSERVKKASTSDTSLKETSHINTSLLMLGRCISLLSEGNSKHIPFRNSKLTHLLSSSLGGNANTCLLCTVSPATRNRQESNSSLAFASRAKKIVNLVHKNAIRDQTELLHAYQSEIEKLKAELQIAKRASIRSNSLEGGRSVSSDGQSDEELARVKLELSSARSECESVKEELRRMREERDRLLQRQMPLEEDLAKARELIALLSTGTREIHSKLKDAMCRGLPSPASAKFNYWLD